MLPADCVGWCGFADPPPIHDPGGRAPDCGDLLGGRWRLLAPIGCGAMGRVFSARDEHDERIVAVKLLGTDDPAEVVRFVTGARALARLEHPNVVRALGSGMHEGHPYSVMELVRGPSLAELCAEHGPPAVDVALRLFHEIVAGVAAIHAAGIAHRDLKLGNILVDGEGHARITDFGLAMPLHAACRLPPDEVAGTPGYMAPELAGATASTPTIAADVYALGVLAFELLTGHRPFESDLGMEVFEQTIHREPPSVRSWRAALPLALDDVFATALAKLPAQRFAGAQELAEALRAALA